MGSMKRWQDALNGDLDARAALHWQEVIRADEARTPLFARLIEAEQGDAKLRISSPRTRAEAAEKDRSRQQQGEDHGR